MNLLNWLKSLFTKKKKEMVPKESQIIKGMPKTLGLSKKNLMIVDVFDAAIYSNDNIVACGTVAINQIKKTEDEQIKIKLIDATAPIPDDSNLRLELSGIMYDPKTHKIEYNFYPSIKDVKRVEDYEVSFKADNITTAVVSTEMVERTN